MVIVSFAIDVSPATAQTSRPGRPYRGLFGGGTDDSEQSLVGTASVGGGYDTDVLAAALGQNQRARSGQGGGVTQGSAGLNYILSLDRIQIGSSAGTSAQYYPTLSETLLQAHGASAGASVRLVDRPSVTANQSLSYQPYTFLGAIGAQDPLVVGQSAPPDANLVPALEHYLSYQGGLDLSQSLSRRVSMSSNYQYRKSDRQNRDFFSQGVQANLRVGLSRNTGLLVGYRLNQGRYSGGRTYWNHMPTVGVDFGKALSLTRRTALSIAAGSTAIESGGRTQVRATGNASVIHEIGRTWMASAGFSRGLRYTETFDEPIFSDAANITFGGLINRRVQVSTSVAASRGQVGSIGQNSFNTLSGSAGVSVALSRFSSLSVSYSRYQYNFERDVQLPESVVNRFGRHGIRANVNLWAPLITTRRRP